MLALPSCTLWCEKPIPIQLDFILRRFAELAEQDGSLRSQQPWKPAYEKDMEWLGAAMVKHYKGDHADVKLIVDAVASAFVELSVVEYQQATVDFMASAERASGGDHYFMRPIASELYRIRPSA